MGLDNVFQAFDRFGFYFFQTLLSFLWQSSLILFPVLLALHIFRKSSPAFRNSIAISGFVALPAILVCSWLINILAVPGKPIPVMPNYVSETASKLSTRATSFSRTPSTGPIEPLSKDVSGVREAEESHTRGSSSSSHALSVPNPLSFPWACGLAIYCLIQIFLILKLVQEWGTVRWWIGHSRVLSNLPVCRVFWRAAHEFELRTGQFEVMESPELPSPVTVGAVLPRIVLPEGFAEDFNENELKTVVYHELAHVHRKDPFIFSCIAFVRTILFFHPLVLLVIREFCLIAEQDCDELAIINSEMSSISYAKSLAHIAETLTPIPSRPMQILGIFFGRSILVQRFESILSHRRRRSQRNRTFLPVVAAICISIPLAAAVSLPLVEQDPGSQKTSPLADNVWSGKAPVITGNTACAIPLRDIRIDGSLTDWPKDIARYPIRNHAPINGPTDIDATDIESSADLSVSMMIGYNTEEGRIYVAVTVRDDSSTYNADPEIAAPGLSDACEVYVTGKNHPESPQTMEQESLAVWDMPALRYVMCPNNGAYDRSAWLRNPPYTPALFRGNIQNTGTTCSCVRKGGITTYEWAVRVYNQYPEQPVDLLPGTVIGFDVAIADRDSANDNPALVTWGACEENKCFDTSSLGDLVLANRYNDLSVVSGLIIRGDDAYANVDFALYRGEQKTVDCTTDEEGRFRAILPPGTYTVKLKNRAAHERFYLDKIAVTPGSLVTANLRVSMNGFSRLRYEYTELFKTFRERLDNGMGRLAFSLNTGYTN